MYPELTFIKIGSRRTIYHYKTSSLFLMMVLRNLAKIRLACLHNTYDVKIIALII